MAWMIGSSADPRPGLLLRRPTRVRQRVHAFPRPLQPRQVLRAADLDQRQPVALLRLPQQPEVHPRRARRQRLVVAVDLVHPVQVARPANGIAEMVHGRDHARRHGQVVHVPVRVLRHRRPRPHERTRANVHGLAPRCRRRQRQGTPPVEHLRRSRVAGDQVVRQERIAGLGAARRSEHRLLLRGSRDSQDQRGEDGGEDMVAHGCPGSSDWLHAIPG
jgi:hypothetical protein